jgi:hypothetical protein
MTVGLRLLYCLHDTGQMVALTYQVDFNWSNQKMYRLTMPNMEDSTTKSGAVN